MTCNKRIGGPAVLVRVQTRRYYSMIIVSAEQGISVGSISPSIRRRVVSYATHVEHGEAEIMPSLDKALVRIR